MDVNLKRLIPTSFPRPGKRTWHIHSYTDCQEQHHCADQYATPICRQFEVFEEGFYSQNGKQAKPGNSFGQIPWPVRVTTPPDTATSKRYHRRHDSRQGQDSKSPLRQLSPVTSGQIQRNNHNWNV